MKTGVAYLESPEKRAVDLTIGCLLSPVDKGAEALAWATFAEAENLFFIQERVGQHGGRLLLKKIRTLDDNGRVLSPLADLFRNKGLDELPQLAAIREGTMSFFGTRPLIPDEEEYIRWKAGKTLKGRNLLAQREDIVTPAKRGLASRYGFYSHLYGYNKNKRGYDINVKRRLNMDIKDHVNASFAYDMRTLLIGLRLATHSEILRRKESFNPSL